jgi:hypothetical protein
MSESKRSGGGNNHLASARREELVALLSQAACRLAGICGKSSQKGTNLSESSKSSVRVLDLSSRKTIDTSVDKLLNYKEI